jgi:Skp family chaperone for outer membrane proteins
MMKYIIFLLTFFIALPSLASEDPEAIKREIFLENVEMFCLNLDKGQWLSQSSCKKVIIAWEEEKRRVANEIVGDKLEAQRSESVILHNRVKEIEKFSKPIIIPDDVRIQQRLAPVR